MDGVLLDNRRPCYLAVRKVLEHYRCADDFSEEKYMEIWGPDVRMFWRLAGIPDSVPFEETDAKFWEIYPTIPHHSCFEGAGEALFELSASGIVLALVSAAREHDVHLFLDLYAFGNTTMYDLFSAVAGRILGRAESVSFIAERLGVTSPSAVAYVDDSPEALKLAKERGYLAIGMLEGHASGRRIRAAEPHNLISSPKDLVGIVENYS